MGFLDRFLGSSGDGLNINVKTTIKQHFKVTVPAAHATAVQAGLERWAHSKGWAAVVKAERDGDNVKLSFEHDESMPGKPPEVDTTAMSDELQRVVKDALGQQPS